ncbi:MAG: PAS domain-containing protein [Alphaproteobacteria bacterium]|nr:PAS domain-containing protein [Alphaproteobacteria bacterium]
MEQRASDIADLAAEANVTSMAQIVDLRWIADLRRTLGDVSLPGFLDQMPPFCIASHQRGILLANQPFRAMRGEMVVAALAQSIARAIATRQNIRVRHGLGDERGRYVIAEIFPIVAPAREAAAAGVLLLDGSQEAAELNSTKRELKRSYDIMRSTSDWVWEVDQHGCLTHASDRSIDAIGLPPSILRGRPLHEFAATDRDRERLQKAFGLRQAFRDMTVSLRDMGGQVRTFHLGAVPVFSEADEFAGFRGTATDVTQQVRAQAAAEHYKRELETTLSSLREKNQQLDVALASAEASSRAKSDFLAVMSHELRTPLNAIIGFSETMASGLFGTLSERYQEYVNDILASGRHLLTLIDDILDLARVENAALKIELRQVPLGNLLVEAYRIVAGRANAKGIRLEEPRGPLNAMLLVDSTRAVQIVVNLLNNAVKFTPSGGRVGVEIATRPDRRIAITVWDTGPGVPPDKQAIIFEKFEQGGNGVLSREQGGIGVGLTIARELARRLGGDLVLDATSSSGSRFSAILPLA